MTDRAAIRWTWIFKVIAAVLIAYAIGVGIMGSVSETRANMARVSAQP